MSEEQAGSVLGGERKVGRPPKNPEVGQEVLTITKSDLAAMFREISQQNADQTSALVGAILESKKPYVDPRQQQNEDVARKQMRELQERIKKNIMRSQDVCRHLQGCNEISERDNGLTSIIKHVFDDGVMRGICTNCQKFFEPSPQDQFGRVISPEQDREYTLWMSKSCGNRPSMAGQRFHGAQRKVVEVAV